MIQLFDLLNDSQMQFWDDYVKSHPKGTPFHLSNWIKTIYETYQFEPLMYVKVNNENKISGIFPCFLIKLLFNKARIVSLPFSDYGGPLCNLEHTEQELIQTIIDNYKGRINYFEIRSRLSNTCSLISHNFYRRHILMLDKDTDISKIADRKTIQYSMRKALKSGVEIS